jgi:putative FmdB family regulatory protein
MPTYEYVCKGCGEHLEVVQSFKEDALTTCPGCAGELRKVFSAAGIIFKGSGWHVKDYASSSRTAAGGSDGSSDGEATGSGSSGSGDGASSSSSDTSSSGSTSGSSSGSSSSGSSDGGSSAKPAASA